jgi:GW (Gly-Tryp) dipeptide domain
LHPFKWPLSLGLLIGIIFLPLFAIAALAAPAACPGAPAPRLSAGMTAQPAQVFSSLRAGLDSNDILVVMLWVNGDTFTILDGPKCASGPYNWYQVKFKGTIGWVTEGTDSTYWVEPGTTTPIPTPIVVPTMTPIPVTGLCPGAPTPRLKVGDIARPAQVFSSLRAALDSNDVLFVMTKAAGNTFTILAGPTCASGPYNWYQVNFKGTIGWVTEGTDSTYWVERVP